MTSVLHTQLKREQLTASLIPTIKFVGIGILWIVLSDLTLFLSQPQVSNHFPIFHLEVVKGILFVLAMGLFFFFLQRKNDQSQTEFSEFDLFSKNPNAMWIIDLQTLQFMEVNEAAIDRYGYTREQFLSMTIIDIRPPEDIDNVQSAIQQLRSGYRFIGRSRHLRKDNTLFESEISAYGIMYKTKHAALIMAQDITKQIAAENALADFKISHEKMTNNKLYELALQNKELQVRIREVNANNDELIEVNKLLQHASRNAMSRYESRLQRSQQVFHSWIENISEAFWSFDIRDPKELFVSKGTLALYACEKSLVVDQPNFWETFVHSDDKLRIKEESMALNYSDTVQLRYRHTDGTKIIAHKIELIRDEDEKVVKVVNQASVLQNLE